MSSDGKRMASWSKRVFRWHVPGKKYDAYDRNIYLEDMTDFEDQIRLLVEDQYGLKPLICYATSNIDQDHGYIF